MIPSFVARSFSVLFLVAPVLAQDLNIDCGPPPMPSDQYGAASGQAGYWNWLEMNAAAVPLLDLAGQPTDAVASTTNTCDNYTCGNCNSGTCSGFSGTADDAALLGSWINADCALEEHKVFLSHLEAGRYVAYLYTYGCTVPPAASVQLFVPGASYNFGTQGVVFQGTWSGFPVGRYAFQLESGGGITMRFWGIDETGLAGIQLDRLEPTGQVSCLGDGTGAACPCGNSGLPGHGCRNSQAVRGGELGAVGSASLSFDTLGFAGGYLRAGALCILLQGDQVIAPVVFGDGLRCAGGTLKRMYIAHASSTGTLSVPPNGGPSVSARSAALGDTLQQGDLRAYQIWYRDGDPAFCPPPQGSTTNVTNAVEIAWQG